MVERHDKGSHRSTRTKLIVNQGRLLPIKPSFLRKRPGLLICRLPHYSVELQRDWFKIKILYEAKIAFRVNKSEFLVGFSTSG